mmetsp:Transcript_28743/g.61699  ORF Transcript_28743/g.61699 Transcript_28743/m.61699 type:complete len:546 (-) Transcript_28743:220-1857(-)|eukprot:CAMPEP_0201127970 /NCGR_PEP_ID=MMETSP0850-20130426/32156_1 /ASSEMBLY_ACC=CAM_ASM_000622 /TAXON_ID=183588 /ORGANISM="Pseudo-nitzschia fraudulenta, Strain WWA7" /LENGTH=545 /DNA_ID=CAMNT_0047396991 /DNA_START=85 /DNA_END=1722 /DNA_ORIENTATION=+
MADEDWLKFDKNNGADAANVNAVSHTELPLRHLDQNQEVQMNYEYGNDVDNDIENPMSTKRRCLGNRRTLCVMLIVVVVIGAALALSMTMLSPFGKQDESGSSFSSTVGSSSTHSSTKEKLENDSIGSNHVSAPTPADIQYGGRPTTSPGPTPMNAFKIADIIDTVARKGGNEFKDPNSYQSLAKKWVLTQDFSHGSSMTIEQQAEQLYALACIYYGTFSVRSEWTNIHYGPDVALPGWYSSRGWLGSAEDVCSNWHGLTCNQQGRILKIELDTNGLTGAFPPETALLHETLNTIDLYNNMVHNVGDEGNSFLGELTNLEYLYLGTTSFEYDGIPSAIGKLTALKELDVSYSLYFGSLNGETFSNLSNLRYLVMDGNAYNTSLPSELAQLPELEYLYAGFSFLEGGIDFVSSMEKIVELWVDDNPGLKGTIPSTIGNLKNLASLSASNCALIGTIPTEIGGITNMVQMWLNDNNLSGEVPSEIANLVTMKILHVQDNNLKGDMPSNICSRRRPFGRLEELGADCDDDITCDDECCTCCGNQCAKR